MNEILLIISIALNILILFLLFKKSNQNNFSEIELQLKENFEKAERNFRDEFSRSRDFSDRNAKNLREELNNSFKNFNDSLLARIFDNSNIQANQFKIQKETLDEFAKSVENKFEILKDKIEEKLKEIQNNNSQKLDEMRVIVDEKLHATLEKRLGESFKLVSERLEIVHKGLGEMQNLANGVGDLKRVLTNVKSRGILGEYQLENLLEQFLTKEQFAKNVKTKEESNAIVEFAIKLPGKYDNGKFLWLPIDAKFPVEDYQLLITAYDEVDLNKISDCKKSLATRIKGCAKDIQEKYLDPPNTTDFGIMFLPFEGLYAEVLRIDGLFETIQKEFRVTIAGPTTLLALLNSLQMGFRTLAIEKRSSEVWQVLGEVKNEFVKFGNIIEKTKEKIRQAGNELDKVNTRTRAMQRKLSNVQELPAAESKIMLEENLNLENETSEDDIEVQEKFKSN